MPSGDGGKVSEHACSERVIVLVSSHEPAEGVCSVTPSLLIEGETWVDFSSGFKCELEINLEGKFYLVVAPEVLVPLFKRVIIGGKTEIRCDKDPLLIFCHTILFLQVRELLLRASVATSKRLHYVCGLCALNRCALALLLVRLGVVRALLAPTILLEKLS